MTKRRHLCRRFSLKRRLRGERSICQSSCPAPFLTCVTLHSGRERQFPTLPDCCHSSKEAERQRSEYWRVRDLTLPANDCCRLSLTALSVAAGKMASQLVRVNHLPVARQVRLWAIMSVSASCSLTPEQHGAGSARLDATSASAKPALIREIYLLTVA